MKMTIKIIINLMLIIITFNSSARIGLGEWSRKTPSDSEINNFSGNGLTLRLKNGQQLQDLSKWYFYKENVIGQLHDETYFIANEKTCQVNYFQSVLDFNHFSETHSYKPIFWTRWHTTNWAPLDDILFLSFIFFPFSGILVILFCVICYKSVITEKLNYTKPFTVVLIGILLLALTNIMLERFPQSI